LRKFVNIAREKGASSWLSELPIQKHELVSAFVVLLLSDIAGDHLISPLPVLVENPSIEHSLNCSFGGLP